MLDAAADGDVVDAGGDEGRGEVDRLLGRPALAVDVVAGVSIGRPASSQALRPMLKACSPNCWTQPATTSSTSEASIPVRSMSSE